MDRGQLLVLAVWAHDGDEYHENVGDLVYDGGHARGGLNFRP